MSIMKGVVLYLHVCRQKAVITKVNIICAPTVIICGHLWLLKVLGQGAPIPHFALLYCSTQRAQPTLSHLYSILVCCTDM
jgi:hypothetical protein